MINQQLANDPFYKLLWRHVFAVTIIQNRVDIVDKTGQNSFIAQIGEYFEKPETKAAKLQNAVRREKALDYLEKWGDRFFEDVEYRTKEVAHRFEQEVKSGLVSNLAITFPDRCWNCLQAT